MEELELGWNSPRRRKGFIRGIFKGFPRYEILFLEVVGLSESPPKNKYILGRFMSYGASYPN